MCGRFTLTATADEVTAAFGVDDPPELAARYNVAPSQVITVIGLKPDGERRGVALLRWGLVPHWATSPNDGPRPINLRAETVSFKFGKLLSERRCLIPADGFYEWRTEGKAKRPSRFTLKSGKPFAFAGLWDVWGAGEERLLTCCLITTSANDVVRPVHDRMPVILPPAHYTDWLDPGTPFARLDLMRRPYPADEMQETAVGTAVNSPKNDGP